MAFAIASGGKHGTEGVWGNGSSFDNGVGGAGGDGGDGIGDEGWSFGGGGGSGAYIKVRYQNTTTEPIYLGLTIGAGGLKAAGYNGEYGVHGYAKVVSSM
ncbi:hypothetical protein [Acinetobacter baumannii]|uniref:hypothetical protein n=1 Tax=Acinetobacter baumannii TaxID=470 RepID=UPI000A508D00|nr:hypothetical protein [Acinetobacter baumannii]